MASTLENQRKTERVPPEQPNLMIFGLGPHPIPAVVLDESFGGLGIAAPVKIEAGAEIDIKMSDGMGGIRTVALVRHAKPLPSGTRVGLEWKAMALSRCLRDLLSAQKTSKKHQSLSRILPGGLSVMWKLFEGGRWEHLIDGADRLRKESAACNVQELSAPIERFQATVRDAMKDESKDPREAVRLALDGLILKCVQTIS